MNKFGLALAIGITLSASGLATIFFLGNEDIVRDLTESVPAGETSYSAYYLDLDGGAPFSGTFECTSGGTVTFSVLDEEQYAFFTSGKADHGTRFSKTGMNGSFSIEQVDMEGCYLVIEHGTGIVSAQSVRVHYDVRATNWPYFVVGTGMVMTGGAVGMAGARSRIKARETKLASVAPAQNDVVFYEEERRR